MSPVMVVSPRLSFLLDRESADEKAKHIVLSAYRDALLQNSGSREAFGAALTAYSSAYPHVSKELAGHAVAHILTTAGM